MHYRYRWRIGPIVATLARRSCVARQEPLSPGPYRSLRELSLAGSVDPVIWCPPTFVGNSGIERFNALCGFALLFLSISAELITASPSGTAVILRHRVSPFGEPDDKLRRSIQYAAALRSSSSNVSGILGHPLSRVMTGNLR